MSRSQSRFAKDISDSQQIAVKRQIEDEYTELAPLIINSAPVKLQLIDAVKLDKIETEEDVIPASIYCGNHLANNGLQAGLHLIANENVSANKLTQALALACKQMQKQVQSNNSQSLSSLIAITQDEHHINVASANVGCHQVILCLFSAESWRVIRLNQGHTDSIEQEKQRLNVNASFTNTDVAVQANHTRCFGGKNNQRPGVSNSESINCNDNIDVNMPALLIVTNHAWADDFNEQDIQRVLDHNDNPNLTAEYCQQLTQQLASLSRGDQVTSSVNRNHYLVSVLPLAQSTSSGAITLLDINSAVNGTQTAKQVNKGFVDTFKKSLAIVDKYQRIQLPYLSDAQRNHTFYHALNDDIDRMRIALACLHNAIEKEQSGFLARLMPKFRESNEEKALKNTFEKTNELITTINNCLSTNTDLNKLDNLNVACEQFEKAIYKTSLSQKCKAVILNTAKILVFTALSLVSLAFMPSVLGLTMPSFAFYAAVLNGTASLTSTPAILTGSVLAMTFLFQTKSTLASKPEVEQVKSVAKDITERVEDVRLVLG